MIIVNKPPNTIVNSKDKLSAKNPASGPPIIAPTDIASELIEIIVALFLLGINL